MKYFRHPPLAFWAAVLLLSAGFVAVAYVSAPDNSTPTVYFSTRSDLVVRYRAMAKDLTLEVEANLATSESLAAWAQEASAFAASAEGQSSNAMKKGWVEARLAAVDIEGLTELDSQAATRAIKRVNAAADNLASLASTGDNQPKE